jgi:DNA-binding GntR family transcriptional regulator
MKKIRTVRDLKGEVYRIIKEGIVSRKIPPGTQLREGYLVQKLGVSRTPIREALNQLSKEGIVETFPRKGAVVKTWTRDEVMEILVLRGVLEGVAARLAAKRLDQKSIAKLQDYFKRYRKGAIDYIEADENFHRDILEASSSKRLIALVNHLEDSLAMMDMRAVIFRFPERIRESLREHQKIIDALETGDEDLAEQLVREHFRGTRSYYESHLSGASLEEDSR